MVLLLTFKKILWVGLVSLFILRGCYTLLKSTQKNLHFYRIKFLKLHSKGLNTIRMRSS